MDRRQAIACLGAAALPIAWSRRGFADAPRTMGIVAKVADTAWFGALARGAAKAAVDFGMHVDVVGPETLDPKAQVALIDSFVAGKMGAIGLIPVDPAAAEPALERARAAGITIVTQEGAAQQTRDCDVELVDLRKFAEAAMQALAVEMGEQGEYAVYVDSLTAPAHDRWADTAVAYQKAHYPRMKLAAAPFAGADEVASAYRTGLGLFGAGTSLRGVLGFGPDAMIGIALALRERQLQKRIALVGTVLPKRARQWIEDGTIRQGLFWNPIDTGYGLVAVARLLLDGQHLTDGMVVPGLGRATLGASATLALDRMMRVNKDNLFGWLAERV
jgi:simple sugar transport system substrate-binding protein